MQILSLIIGIAVGAVIAWLWSNSRAQRLVQAEREQSLAVQAAAQAAAQAEAQAERDQRIEAQTRLQETEKLLQSEAALVEEAKRQLGDTFKAISSDALRQNSEAFVQRAQQTLEPVKDTLKRYEDQIKAIENAYRQTYGSLDQQLKSLLVSEQQLQRETNSLVSALRQPQVRGRWGELTLHRVVELAGLSEHCDYVEQQTVQSDGGRLRPDMIVNLPAGRQVVIDAKCALDGYLSAIEAHGRRRPQALPGEALPADARSHELAGAEELLGPVQLDPGVRGHVRAGRVVPPRRRRPRPEPDRGRHGEEGAPRQPHQPYRPAARRSPTDGDRSRSRKARRRSATWARSCTSVCVSSPATSPTSASASTRQ